MPQWMKDYLFRLGGTAGWFIRWVVGPTVGWLEWVDGTLHGLTEFAYKTYIITMYEFANFTYYVGSFTQAANGWVTWLAWERIPNAYYGACQYAYKLVRGEIINRRDAITNLRNYLLKFIVYIAGVLQRAIDGEIVNRRAAITNLRNYLLIELALVRAELKLEIANEIAARKLAVRQLRDWTAAQLANLWAYAKSILPAVDKEAADGYNATRTAHGGILASLLSDLAGDNPAARDVITRLAGFLIDLAEIDDPVIRLLANTLLKTVIEHLAKDVLQSGLASTLIGQFLGAGPPKTLQEVTTSIGDRLNTTEDQWRQFYQMGGDDIERLGSTMRESASLLFTVPMAGYFAAAVADPEGTAAATDDVVTPAVRAILAPVLALLGG